MRTAQYWKNCGDDAVRCELCPNYCVIRNGHGGSCGVRYNRDGTLYADGYGRISSSNVDPIEKKPLYHFRPGTDIFSVGGWGCNLHCSFCQNWSISQDFIRDGAAYSPEQIVAGAERAGTSAVAYTYNEPLISVEFVLACSALARERGLQNVAVTNGYVSSEAREEIVGAIDAFNVDIKSMDDDFYRRNCGGKLRPILEFCESVRGAGKHLEITNLIIPGENDSPATITELVDWIADSLGSDVPLHFSAYRPQYKMTNKATDVSVLRRAHDAAACKLHYVYLGNVVTSCGQDTACPGCGECVISRTGYATTVSGVVDETCRFCGIRLPGFCW